MYCTNLKYKALTDLERYSLNEKDELVGTVWEVYNLKNQKTDLELLYSFDFETKDTVVKTS